MQGPAIVNIINFIRAVEPRLPMDLVEPVVRQVELVQQHNLPATWLLQYDALIDERFTRLLPRNDPRHEIGVWFEVVQPLVEDTGLTWHGRYPWDWHCDVGFSIGYTPAERERLADVCMKQFRRIYGNYPRSVGSWFMDAHLLGYLSDRYHIVAACNCRDQWGTDGYTLWGGYYSQAYYPSRLNAYMPAQTRERQIPVPVFRMLGSDPIYQYDCSLGENGQGVVTLEPVYQKKGGGGDPKWVRWFFEANHAPPTLAFSYAQVGQENSFGWAAMGQGLTDQIQYLAGIRATNNLRIETLAESGAWFRSQFAVTPATAITALTDWKQRDRKSIWYNTAAYRANFYWDGPHFRIRDIQRFDETYAERYLTVRCNTAACTYDTLPVVDGFRWSGPGVLAGLYLEDGKGHELEATGQVPRVREVAPDTLAVEWLLTGGHTATLRCQPGSLSVRCTAPDWQLRLRHAPGIALPFTPPHARTLNAVYEGHAYAIPVRTGNVMAEATGFRLVPEAGTVALVMDAATAG